MGPGLREFQEMMCGDGFHRAGACSASMFPSLQCNTTVMAFETETLGFWHARRSYGKSVWIAGVQAWFLQVHRSSSFTCVLRRGRRVARPTREGHLSRQVTASTVDNGHRYGPEQPPQTASSGQYGSKRPPTRARAGTSYGKQRPQRLTNHVLILITPRGRHDRREAGVAARRLTADADRRHGPKQPRPLRLMTATDTGQNSHYRHQITATADDSHALILITPRGRHDRREAGVAARRLTADNDHRAKTTTSESK